MDKKPSYEELEKRIKTLEQQLKNTPQTTNTQLQGSHDIDQLIQAMAIPAFVIDQSHLVTHWNKACEKLTNIKSVDIVGTHDAWKAFYKEKRPVLADLVVDCAVKDKVSKYYDKFSRTELVDDGLEAQSFFSLLGDSGKWLYFTATPLKDDSGNIIGAIETFQDITKRIRAERYYRLLLKAIPDPVIVYDPQQKITYINEAFEEAYGWTKEDLIGGTIDFVPNAEKEKTKNAWQKTFDGKKIFFETKRKTKQGNLLDVQLRTAVLKDPKGDFSASIVIHRDLTKIKQAEKERESLIEELQKALAEVKSLSGLIPICASCKKIRDDNGYWNQLELYLEKHSDASLSHGICPDCSDELYGDKDWYIKMKDKKR